MKAAFSLHRSVWFWLGCFVLLFLVWVWGDSWKTRTVVSRPWVLEEAVARGRWEDHGFYADYALVECGNIFIRVNRPRLTEPAMRANYSSREFLREAAEPEDEEWMAMPEVSREVDDVVTGATVVIDRVNVPMWLVVGVYLVVCGGGGGGASNIEHRTLNFEF